MFYPIGSGLAELEAEFGLDAAALTWRAIASNTFLFERVLLPRLKSGARELLAVAQGASAIVGSTLAAGAAIAANALGVPFVSVALQPAIVFSAYDPPRLPNAPWLEPANGGPQLQINRATRAIARAVTDRWTRPVDRLRIGLGVNPERRNLLLDGLCGRALALGVYSALLSSPQPDAPPGFNVVGYDSEAGGPVTLPPVLQRFLTAGSAPMVFTLGRRREHGR